MCWGGGVGFAGLKGIKVTRCNRMALRVCVGVCVCWSQRGQELLLWLSSFNSVNLSPGIFSLSRHAHSLTLSIMVCFSLPSSYTLHIPFIPLFWYGVTPSFICALFVWCHISNNLQWPRIPPFSMKVSVLGYKMWESCNHTLNNATMPYSYLLCVCVLCDAMIHGLVSSLVLSCRPISL